MHLTVHRVFLCSDMFMTIEKTGDHGVYVDPRVSDTADAGVHTPNVLSLLVNQRRDFFHDSKKIFLYTGRFFE